MKMLYLVDDDFLDAVDALAEKVREIHTYGHPVLDASAVMILGKDLQDLMAKQQIVEVKLDDDNNEKVDERDDDHEDA